jgi:hypothetical protein
VAIENPRVTREMIDRAANELGGWPHPPGTSASHGLS